MKYLNQLAKAKRDVTVEGQIVYVAENGAIKRKLNRHEKYLYKVEKSGGVQYVYERGKQILPPPEKINRPEGEDVHKVQRATHGKMGRAI